MQYAAQLVGCTLDGGWRQFHLNVEQMLHIAEQFPGQALLLFQEHCTLVLVELGWIHFTHNVVRKAWCGFLSVCASKCTALVNVLGAMLLCNFYHPFCTFTADKRDAPCDGECSECKHLCCRNQHLKVFLRLGTMKLTFEVTDLRAPSAGSDAPAPMDDADFLMQLRDTILARDFRRVLPFTRAALDDMPTEYFNNCGLSLEALERRAQVHGFQWMSQEQAARHRCKGY
jgi:hypothetical protein